MSLFKRAEARNTEINHSKFIILKAKDTVKHTRTDGKYKSILERFQKTKDSEKVKLFITGMKRGVEYLHYLVTVDTTHKASHEQRERYDNMWRIKCGSTNFHLGPMKARSDYQAATKAIVALAAEEGQNVKYNPKEDRFRSDALDPELEKWLT